jgi:hypothetical protein
MAFPYLISAVGFDDPCDIYIVHAISAVAPPVNAFRLTKSVLFEISY